MPFSTLDAAGNRMWERAYERHQLNGENDKSAAIHAWMHLKHYYKQAPSGEWVKLKKPLPFKSRPRRNPWEHTGGGCRVGKNVDLDSYSCDDDYYNDAVNHEARFSTTDDAHYMMPPRIGRLSDLSTRRGVKLISVRKKKSTNQLRKKSAPRPSLRSIMARALR